MISLDLVLALGSTEFMQFFWLLVLMDVPRYLLAAAVLAVVPPQRPAGGHGKFSVCGLVACHNEEHSITACVASMRLNGIGQIVVVNDGSTDCTHEVLRSLGVTVIDLAERVGKPDALNIGLPSCHADLVLAADADTTFLPGAIAQAVAYFEPGVGSVGLRLDITNEATSLVTRYQAIEYAINFTAGRRIADIFGIMPNISGAAGLFRREALIAVGGWDCEIAEDAALAMKLRINGWQLRYASEATACTVGPVSIVNLLLQRLRWDAGIITIWWFKYRGVLNPFSARFSVANLFTSLEVLTFGAVMPLILPVYFFWLWERIEATAFIFLGAVMIVLLLLDVLILLFVRVSPRLLLHVPFYVVVETIVMRPLRVIALVAEATFSISRYDPYLPREQRSRLT